MSEKEQDVELEERIDDIANDNNVNVYKETGSERNDDSQRETHVQIKNDISLYGNDTTPFKLGKTIALLYIRDFPLITIGPNCIVTYIYNCI